MKIWCGLATFSISLLVSAIALAQGSPIIDGSVRVALRSGRQPGSGGLLPLSSGRPETSVTLIFDGPVTSKLVDSIERLPGVRLYRVEGRFLYRGRLVPAFITEVGLSRLARMTHLERVSIGIGPGPAQPLDHTTSLSGIEAARSTWVGDRALTGQGTVIADLDSHIDVFHPDFFAADGGAYPWIDVNGDDNFDPGIDGVDLDGDGEVGDEELLEILSAATIFSWTAESIPARPSWFAASWDWVYADSNGNRIREFGPEDGFDEDTPAYGEPLFIVDDIDGDDILGVDERLIRLSTSRIRAVGVIGSTGEVAVYRRGDNLIDIPDMIYSRDPSTPESDHATAVLSIAAGGVARSGRAMTGFAPDADILVSYNLGEDLVAAAMWALDEDPDVVLHEYAPWATVTLDGSDPLSALINESTVDDGIVHVCPVGNTGGSKKHTMVDIQEEGLAQLTLEVPEEWGFAYAMVSLHFLPGAAEIEAFLDAGSGESHAMSGEEDYFYVDDLPFQYWRETTPAGTGMLHIQAGGHGVEIPSGSWTFQLENRSPDTAVTVHGYVMDDLSSWAEGVAWNSSIATDVSNIGLPATAEHCIAVGAHTGHVGSWEQWWFRVNDEGPGAVRIYSGRGPRIDGYQKPDIVAADNPLAAYPRWDVADLGLGTYTVFGGTSGAGPHVAGAALLLAQLDPEAGAEDIIDSLLTGAIADHITGAIPNYNYGYGRLSVAGALSASPGRLSPPLLTLEAPELLLQGEEVFSILPVVVDTDGDASQATIRWDVGYDGIWDGDFGVLEEIFVEMPQLELDMRFAVKAEARDESGLVGRAVAWVRITDEIEPDAGPLDADVMSDAGSDADMESFVATGKGGDCACRAVHIGGHQFGDLARRAISL